MIFGVLALGVARSKRAAVSLPRSVPDGSLKVISHSPNMPCAPAVLGSDTVLKVTLPQEYEWDIAVIDPDGDWLYFMRHNLTPGATLALDPRTESSSVETNDRGEADMAKPRLMFKKSGDYRIVMSEVLDSDIEDIIYRAWCTVQFTNLSSKGRTPSASKHSASRTQRVPPSA